VTSPVDEAQIVSYLLGDLDENERARLEERFLRDVEYRDLIRSVEDDLVDDYLRGELPPHQRELFEKQFASHPQRAQKVELARALNRALDERPRVITGKSATVLRAPVRSRAPISAFRYPLAAAAVLLLGLGLWLVMETRRSGPPVEQPQAQQQTPRPEDKPPTPPPDRSTPPGAQLSIATFVLPPGLVRDSTAARTFVIPEGTQIVRLRLPVEKGDEYPVYRAELRTASGRSVWKSDALNPQADAAGQSVVLDLPADLLPPDRYELTLTGVNKDVVEDIGYYYFSFAKK
jgi:hypothetical protein